MRPAGYENMDQFEKDHARVCKSPNDKKLIDSVQRKVNATESALRRRIVDRLLDEMLETNPLGAFELIMDREENRGKVLMINDPKDPWFYC